MDDPESTSRIVTVFRSRLRDDCPIEEYQRSLAELGAIARRIPGFGGETQYTSDSGERLTVVEFGTEEAHGRWARHPRHLEAKVRGRQAYYASYHIQICRELSAREWSMSLREEG